MEIALPGPDYPTRVQFRTWLDQHRQPSGRDLAEAGFVAPHWPAPWGLGATPVDQLVIDDELRRAGLQRPANPIGIGWAGPTLLHAGTPRQQDRYLPPLLAGEEIWCQLFSEPDAGSDLAALTTRAERHGTGWLVYGRKVWTSYAHRAHQAILLARTDPLVPSHAGISYFVCPMDAPGITVRPIVDMTGTHTFNEVVLDGVRLGREHLVGEEHRGWALARVTLSNERVSLSGEGALWGMGPTADDLVQDVRRHGGLQRADLRQRLVAVWIEGEVLRSMRLRGIGATLAGHAADAAPSVAKALADGHGQRVMNLAKDLAGLVGLTAQTGSGQPVNHRGGEKTAMAAPVQPGSTLGGPIWSTGFLFAPALTIGGGTAEVQRNIIAEHMLGLDR